jgi:TM2 domain-containing membrane protein YozV
MCSQAVCNRVGHPRCMNSPSFPYPEQPEGQPYSPEGQPYNPEAQPYSSPGQPYNPAGQQPYSPVGQPPPYPPVPPGAPGWSPGFDAYGQPLSDKSKLTAGLLGIFLGSFGVGRFYLGYTGIGIAQIAATWLTCGIGGIWPLIDSIMILVGKVPDAEGRTLRE